MIKIEGTTYSFRTFSDWINLYVWRVRAGRASSDEYKRQSLIFFALEPSYIDRSSDVTGITRLLDFLRAGKKTNIFNETRLYSGQEHLNSLIIAAHNRHHQLVTGSAFRDRSWHGEPNPALMPDKALNRVIQSCRDLALVERARIEKARRMRSNDNSGF